MIVTVKYPVFYEVVYRHPHSQRGNFALGISLGCFEDVRDAVQKIVTVSRDKKGKGELGIVRTSIKNHRKFVPSSYNNYEQN